MSDELNRVRGVVSQSIPSANQDAASAYFRLGRHGQLITMPASIAQTQAADEGAYFICTNPTMGTAVASAVNASYDITKGHFVIYNGNSAASGKCCYPDYIKMLPTVAPASGTSAQYALQLDTGNRYSSGGNAGTAKNVNMNSSNTSGVTFYHLTGGTVITVGTATANARIVGRGTMRNVIPAVLESMVLRFGGSGTDNSSATAAGTTVAVAPPVVIGPQQSLVVIVWYPSNSATGISFEFEAGWVER